MVTKKLPRVFEILLAQGCLASSEIRKTADGFFLAEKPLSAVLAEKNVFDFLDSEGERLACDRFFDDWFLYAVLDESGETYGLLKLREQEHDAEDGSPADGDTPGVTVSFIAFDVERLLSCLMDPAEKNRTELNEEVNRVVAYRGQRHHKALKRYFKDPASCGPYEIAAAYVQRMAALAENGSLPVPDGYRATLQRSLSYKKSKKDARLPRVIDALSERVGYTVCDHERIYLKDPAAPTEAEAEAILATHTGNPSVFSFAAEVEYHARFLTPLAKVKIPFFGRSVYDSAIRADLTVGDAEWEGPAPFHQSDSRIVKRQIALHGSMHREGQ